MISLPITVLPDATVVVSVGDKVTAGQTIAQKEGSKEHAIDLSKLLKTSAHKVSSMLHKHPGDAVMKGETLAIKRNALGMTVAKLHSNIGGIIVGYDESSGILRIADSNQSQPYVLVCPIDGVVQVCDNGQIVIETDQNVLQGVSGAGTTARGILHLLSDAKESDQQVFFELNNTIADKIVLARTLPRDAMVKAIGIGAVGFVFTAVDTNDVQYLNDKNMLVPIVVIEEKQLPSLAKQHGREVFMEGSTGTILLLA